MRDVRFGSSISSSLSWLVLASCRLALARKRPRQLNTLRRKQLRPFTITIDGMSPMARVIHKLESWSPFRRPGPAGLTPATSPQRRDRGDGT